jgi:hypothetical protein
MLSLTVVLAFGIYLTTRAGNPPAATTISASVPQPAPGVEAPALSALADEEAEAPELRTSSDEAPGASSAVAGSDRLAETQHEEMTALREEVARLRAEVTAVQQWIRTQGRATTGVAPGRVEDPAKNSRTDSAAQAETERERQKHMEVVEASFRHEPADPRWSFEAEGAVQEALASDEIVQNTLLGLECRSHTCRLELASDDTGELAEVMPLFLEQLGQTLPNVTVNYVDDGGRGKIMILYMSRELNEPPHRGK